MNLNKIRGGRQGQQRVAEAVAMESAHRLWTRRTLERLKLIATGEYKPEEKKAEGEEEETEANKRATETSKAEAAAKPSKSAKSGASKKTSTGSKSKSTSKKSTS